MEKTKKSLKKVSEKSRKRVISGFFSVSFVPFLQVISIFRRYFCWKLSKKALYLQSKKQSSLFKHEFSTNSRSCRLASKNSGKDDNK